MGSCDTGRVSAHKNRGLTAGCTGFFIFLNIMGGLRRGVVLRWHWFYNFIKADFFRLQRRGRIFFCDIVPLFLKILGLHSLLLRLALFSFFYCLKRGFGKIVGSNSGRLVSIILFQVVASRGAIVKIIFFRTSGFSDLLVQIPVFTLDKNLAFF